MIRTHKKKMTTESQDYTVREFLEEFSDEKHLIDKSFQRNLVWPAKAKSSYIQAVAEGRASSPIIVADIRSGGAASRTLSEDYGEKTFQEALHAGYESLSLDGMQRRDTIINFCNSRLALDVVLEDFDDNKVSCKGRLFKDLPHSVRQNFLTKRIHTVRHKNMPYSQCSKTFRDLNSGESLNAQELRTAIATPISQRIRNLAEVTYEDVWSKLQSFNPTNIKRMRNSEVMCHMFMEIMPTIEHKDFVDRSHCDNFYMLGENKFDIANVRPYSKGKAYEVARGIIKEAMACYRSQNTIKGKIPTKTMWAVLYACREVANQDLKILSHSSFLAGVYEADNSLISGSKVQQGKDIGKAVTSGRTAEEAAEDYPDDNYYWRWVNRNGVSKFRQLRIRALIEKLDFSKLAAPSSLEKQEIAA